MICKTKIQSSNAINGFMTIGSPGHTSIPPIQNEEIWACSIRCWIDICHLLIDEFGNHLKGLHSKIEESIHNV